MKSIGVGAPASIENVIERTRRNLDRAARTTPVTTRSRLSDECGPERNSVILPPALAGDEHAAATIRARRAARSRSASSGCGSTRTPFQPACSNCQVCEPCRGSLAPTSTKKPAGDLREEFGLELVLDAVGEDGAHARPYSPAGSFTGCARLTIAVVL